MSRNINLGVRAFSLALAAAAVLNSGCGKKPPQDSQIAAQVQSRLAADPALQGQTISVGVSNGAVTLAGNVSGPGSRELAANDAAGVAGVRTVVNNLVTGAGNSNGQPNPDAGDAMMNGHPIQSYSNSSPQRRGNSGPEQNYSSAPATGPAGQQSIVLPAGTRIRVQLAQALSTKGNQAGDPFSGTVVSPVTVNGQTIIRSGAEARGTVTEAKSQGRFAGQAMLAVRLDSVRADGRSYPIQTSRVDRFEKGKGKRTAVVTGGGAGLGALIGGLAGGGKGALIGGLLGGGAGGAGSAFTGNKDLVLPAESVLTFRLENDITIHM